MFLPLKNAATYRLAHDICGSERLAETMQLAKQDLSAGIEGVANPSDYVILDAMPYSTESTERGAANKLHLSLLPTRRIRRLFGDRVLDCLAEESVHESILSCSNFNGDLSVSLIGVDVPPVVYKTQPISIQFNLAKSDAIKVRNQQFDFLAIIAELINVNAADLQELATVPHLTIANIWAKGAKKVSTRLPVAEKTAESLNRHISRDNPLPIRLGKLMLPRASVVA